MKVNKRLVPLKVHYFFFFGCMAPILPFLIVVAAQLGIPVFVQGTLSAIVMLLTVLTKPMIAGLADTFPHLRKTIFMIVLFLLIGSLSSVWFIPPLKERSVLKGKFVRASIKGEDTKVYDDEGNVQPQPLLLTYNQGSCHVDAAWDCLELCQESCIIRNRTDANINVKKVNVEGVVQIAFYPMDRIPFLENRTIIGNSLNVESVTNATGYLYQLEGVNISWDLLAQHTSLECSRADWIGSNCKTVFRYWQFWVYILLLLLGQIGFSTSNSISDAIAADSTSDDPGTYGNQRAWGTIGWGLTGPLGGLLVDLWSGSSITKDYSPAFLMVLVLGCIDFVTCASSLKVPQLGSKTNVLKDVGPLLRQPRFFLFCCFVIMNGMFDGIIGNFIFVMQEEMAQGTNAMSYIKFIQGLTLFVQCAVEAPFMLVYGWFMERFGAQRVISLVFFMFIFRILGLSLIGFYGPVWATLITELLNGPTFGLGYTAIVVYAAQISPPGASTTIQSIVNICYESFGYASAALLGGFMFDAIGGPMTYLIMGIISCIVFVLHVLSVKFLPAPEGDVEGVANSSLETAAENSKDDFALTEGEGPNRNQNEGQNM